MKIKKKSKTRRQDIETEVSLWEKKNVDDLCVMCYWVLESFSSFQKGDGILEHIVIFAIALSCFLIISIPICDFHFTLSVDVVGIIGWLQCACIRYGHGWKW